MHVVYFGSGDFGLPTVKALLDSDYELAAVVSQPDRRAGRGGKTRPTPISEFAENNSLPLLRPEKPNSPEFAEELAALSPNLCVIVAYGHLIKKSLLAVPRRGFINLHASILPAYRGAAPVPWAILSGETVSGATVFSLDEKFDTGGILGHVELPIENTDTSATYLAKLAPIGADLVMGLLPDFLTGTLAPQAQDDSKASKAPKFGKEDGKIDWTQPLHAIDCKVRAFQPWPLAFTELPTAKGSVRINVLSLEAADSSLTGPPGQILAAAAKSGLIIMTGDKAARISRFQPEGKRPMADTDYLRGSKVLL